MNQENPNFHNELRFGHFCTAHLNPTVLVPVFILSVQVEYF